jgi:hypothetical protein
MDAAKCGAEKRKALGRVRAGLRVVDDEHDAVTAADGEFLPVQVEGADGRVVKNETRPGALRNVMSRPELTELRAYDGQLANEVDDTCVVDGAANSSPETGQQRRCRGLPVIEHVLLGDVQEQVAEPVTPCGKSWRHRSGEGIGSKDVDPTTLWVGISAHMTMMIVQITLDRQRDVVDAAPLLRTVNEIIETLNDIPQLVPKI